MNKSGVLYIVATPIGNLGDISFRAVEVLGKVTRILAEDTRHSRALLNHLGLKKPLSSLHAHNERESALKVIEGLGQGLDYALVSDAGTPLISDPGGYLVPCAQDAGFKVIPIPGACSVIAALSASGITSDRFCFEGFLPVKKAALDQQLQTLVQASITTLFFEAPHRIVRTLEAMEAILGPEREIAIARELTKTFETIKRGSLGAIVQWIKSDPMQQKGEYVLMVSGLKENKATQSQKILEVATEKLLSVLLSELSISQATRLAAKITGVNKHVLYTWAIEHVPKF
ncbi:MAG: 16S rRNA (cytidine(1402)-2'-O)-methyltransferase [Gammaproteobacteria bacterium]|nr:16S rRNA (cytidine(1402)-2'-O)-methyltransferase [Gammaproteobacteria bacterium]MBP9729352.1 16S rRNA (cytidine(1402)-2'-O)-methyltransferase [Gammaproteobacteria bacterium]